MKIKEIRFYRSHNKRGRKGWSCSIDLEPFVAGIVGRGWGCCRHTAFKRAKKDLRKKRRESIPFVLGKYEY